MPYWDFDALVESPPAWDSSAGAIAASGLWQLAGLTRSPDKADTYQKTAIQTVTTLASDAFLARNKPEWEGVLLHGVYHRNKGLGVDESVAWGDFFFVEALARLLAAGEATGKG